MQILKVESLYMDKIWIYTDGACSGNPGPGGWAAIIINIQNNNDLTHIVELGGYEESTTNNRMEMTALGKAFAYLEKTNANIKVFTDSSYVVQGLKSWCDKWSKNGWKKQDGKEVENIKYWQRLYTLYKARIETGQNVELIQIEGHAGIPGNERCDEIAVDYSKGHEPDLFDGSYSEYLDLLGLDILKEPKAAIPGQSKKSNPIYLSLLNGKLERHKTWAECEARVKNQKSVKFKKVLSEEEEKQVLRSWGIITD